jgi:hypothetical protein
VQRDSFVPGRAPALILAEGHGARGKGRRRAARCDRCQKDIRTDLGIDASSLALGDGRGGDDAGGAASE